MDGRGAVSEGRRVGRKESEKVKVCFILDWIRQDVTRGDGMARDGHGDREGPRHTVLPYPGQSSQVDQDFPHGMNTSPP